MIVKTYLCRRCHQEAEHLLDEGDIPQCKNGKCLSYELVWIPGGGHPQVSLRRSDNIMRSLAETYGLSNMKSARAGESVMPNAPAPMHAQAGTYNAASMSMPINMDVNGNLLGGCTPITLPKGTELPNLGGPQPRLPHISQNTKIEARWSKDKGESAA